MTTTEARDAAIREARRYIRDIVRNDWTFEPSSSPHTYPASTDPDREVLQWRLREYDSSGSELEPEPDPEPYPGNQIAIEEDGEAETGAVIADDRHRRRRRQMAEEMGWNEGLRTWMARRDAWAGAKARRSLFGNEGKNKGSKRKGKGRANGKDEANGMGTDTADSPVPDGHENGNPAPDMVSGSPSSGAVISSSSSHGQKEEDEAIATRTEASLTIADKDGSQTNQTNHAQSSPQDKEFDHSTADAEEKRKVSSETAITEPEDNDGDIDDDDDFDETEEEEEEELDSLEEPYIPVVPSIISKTNPIRASITQSMYPSIYSKVVVQGLTPTVPINLADVTKAMVQGWKSDGQWPSKPVNHSIVLPDDATVGKPSAAPGAEANAGGSTETKRRRSSGVANAVRKVLHFSGHPFHRRGPSHDQDGAANVER